jgi:glycosyltransferase involved in cell wall biosynthesis
VVGDGPAARQLRRLAGPTISFTGRATDADVAAIMAGARALIMTSAEEFGIAGIESQAAGRPVIARRGGGALETVLDGQTGCFWSGGPADLARAVEEFDDESIDPLECVRNAARFSVGSFRRGILDEVARVDPASRRSHVLRQPLPSTRLMTLAGQGSRR